MPNIQFRGGRLPNDPSKPRLRLTLSGAQTVYPSSVDWLSQVRTYPMYLNDDIGDCTCAAAGHMLQAWTAAASTEVRVPDSAVLALYEQVSGYNPVTHANDDGAVMQDVLNQWRKVGLGGHKILGFAQVDHTDMNQVKAAINAFGCVYVGINFPQSAMDQFNSYAEWTVQSGSPIDGGHAVNVGKYDTSSLTCVTWGRRQPMTQNWWNHYVEEAWVVVTQEWIESNGLTPAGRAVADLGAEFTQLTGEPDPFPASPTPAPEPVPDPVPSSVDSTTEALVTAVKTMIDRRWTPRYVKRAYNHWVAAHPSEPE